MKRQWSAIAIIAVLLTATGFIVNSKNTITPKPFETWKTGYWIWAGETPARSAFRPEVVYVQTQGDIWPRDVPRADEYIAVRRFEIGVELSRETASQIARDFERLRAQAGAGLSGVQIDYDSPTSKLAAYGNFLKFVRRELP